jgi:hypothetical protein
MELTRHQIAMKHGAAIMGGICRSNKHQCYTIIINPATHYTDFIRPDGTIYYMGQDGGASCRNNKSLNNTIWPLHVYIKVPDTHVYAYLGEYRRHGYAYQLADNKVMFVLRKACPDQVQVNTSFVNQMQNV